MAELRDLVIFEYLKIHQLTIEPKKVKATYTVKKMADQTEVSNELVYSYNSTFFDKKEADDVNLASMMLVQVAINYGLFCKEIIFDGLFDEADKRFIQDMVENTSREIYINKFLSPNEFLKPPFDKLEAKQIERYTAAKLVFENTLFPHLKLTKMQASPAADKFAILSSGGKDSLLTYGLVKEIGEAHPVFINEAGRHWYTAYNAYHHFEETEPNTVKPWCNSDRMFNWMVRQLPFIKENFQNIRADIYPIRLWTVAVFLFGVLPVARKRNIKHVLIGNEYDSTVKTMHKGITNYNALYDQSKYFDNALTRYYQKKGWNMLQYSMLRSMSELLILKTLVKRYPELQRHQVSCHAAHKEGEVMKPCGNCEKCRRIVGMLTALDEDPKRCGYTDVQIEKGLKALETKTVKQIGSDASQLYYLLVSKGKISKNESTSKLAKEHKEITMLRFDNERSMLRDLPEGIRQPLFNILMEHADGQVKMTDRKWNSFTLDENAFSQPYFLNEKQS
ncbi:hypothetical protein R9C00_24430 [Flammeovirgaceae bacterium SG7u.111]|nr:hypothetical protein [Flammeovirgaceae bacterium SG7u.132]WPO34850.1 hypothetical protein R9C00_24430 [Flammeovirgaceae bacterium SG7u.111]